MLNNILKTNGAPGSIWEAERVKSAKTGDKNFTTALDKAARTDTVEISAAVRSETTLSEIGTKKSALVSELSGMHADVNKYLEIKEQVRSGSYELNAADIAKGLTEYSVF